MIPALQMPVERGDAKQVGRRMFRKQVLHVGEIDHKGKRLTFDRPYLSSLVDSFNQRAYDQVPLVLVNEKNEHVSDPEKFRGEIKGLEMTDKGLDALVEMTDEGAAMIEQNPRLGVSVRIVPDLKKSDGRKFPVAIEHVAATLNPVVTGLQDWETGSVLSATHSSDQEVINLSAAEYMDSTQTLTDDHLETLKGLAGDARVAKARELLGETTAAEKPEVKKDESKFSLKKFLGIKDEGISDSELEEAMAKLNADEVKDDKVVSSLSDDDKRRVDLAEENSRKADQRVAAAEWSLERGKLAGAGVPPSMLDIAEPILKFGLTATVDLSNDEKADAGEVIRKMLDAAKGTVDLSEAAGSSKDSDEAKDLASDDKWEASI